MQVHIQSKIKGQDPHQLDEIEQSPGMYKSIDGGMSWFPINNGLPDKDYSRNISDIAVIKQNENNVYINSLFDGLYYTVDGGESWNHLKGDLPEGQCHGMSQIVGIHVLMKKAKELIWKTWSHLK